MDTTRSSSAASETTAANYSTHPKERIPRLYEAGAGRPTHPRSRAAWPTSPGSSAARSGLGRASSHPPSRPEPRSSHEALHVLCCGVARAELFLSPRHRAPRDRGGTTSSCTASFSPSRRASRHPAPKSPLVPLPPTGSSTEPPPCVSLLPKLPPSCRLPPLQLPRDRRPSCLPTKLPPSRRPPPKSQDQKLARPPRVLVS